MTLTTFVQHFLLSAATWHFLQHEVPGHSCSADDEAEHRVVQWVSHHPALSMVHANRVQQSVREIQLH